MSRTKYAERPVVPAGHFRIFVLERMTNRLGLNDYTKDYVDIPVVHVGRSIARRRALPKEKVGE